MFVRTARPSAFLILTLLALPAFGATVFVDLPLGVNYFKPRSIVINVGDTVTWRNPAGGGLHGILTDDNTTINFLPQNGPWTQSFTFNNPGTYSYHCQTHGAAFGVGESGIIFVGNRTQRAAGDHVLQISAWNFAASTDSTTTGIAGSSNLLRTCSSGCTLYSGVTLPSGSEMKGMEVTGCDSDAGAGLVARLLKCDDELSPCQQIATITTTGSPGCTFFSSPAFDEIVDEFGSQYVISVDQGGAVAFRNVRIYYRSPSSYAPGTATFTDVPTTSPFYRFVEALYAAGVTGGCNTNPPQYCPDNPVTRGQMAVFLAQALGLTWPN